MRSLFVFRCQLIAHSHLHADPEVLTAEPYVGTIALNDAADFVVLASDGLWDVMSFEVSSFWCCH